MSPCLIIQLKHSAATEYKSMREGPIEASCEAYPSIPISANRYRGWRPLKARTAAPLRRDAPNDLGEATEGSASSASAELSGLRDHS